MKKFDKNTQVFKFEQFCQSFDTPVNEDISSTQKYKIEEIEHRFKNIIYRDQFVVIPTTDKTTVVLQITLKDLKGEIGSLIKLLEDIRHAVFVVLHDTKAQNSDTSFNYEIKDNKLRIRTTI